MTPQQVAGFLSTKHPMFAKDIAAALKVDLDEAYGALIAAESRGLVRVIVEHTQRDGKRTVSRRWEVM